jgi:histidine ammonia-lyase
MGPTAARKAMEIIENAQRIVAIELLCACQAIDLRGPEKLGEGTKIAYSTIRSKVPMLKEDRVIGKDIEEVFRIVKNGELLKAVEKYVKLV